MTEYISVIPASPGYYPIYDPENGEDPFVVYDPIIAWAVDKNNMHVFPVTPEGACSRNIIGTLNPDKTVTIFGKKTFESFNDYINYRKK